MNTDRDPIDAERAGNAVTIWHQAYPDYAERFVAMTNAARLWMQSPDCALSLVPR